MRHYIQYDHEEDTWALFRLWENKRIRVTSLSEDDLDTIYYQYKIYKRNKTLGNKMLDNLIQQDETMIDLIGKNFNQTEAGKQFIEKALKRLTLLKTLLINSKGEEQDGRDGKDPIEHEGRIVPDITPEEEGIGRSVDSLYP